jgi:RNA polymerase sigma factor (sigma-70 family)
MLALAGFVTHAAGPVLGISAGSSDVVINFSGVLQAAPRLEGPYATVHGTTSPFRWSPRIVSGLQQFWRSRLGGVTISAGTDFTLALKLDGSLWAWGANYFGQLGIGEAREIVPEPTRVIGENWAAVSCGIWHTVALKADGSLWEWGNGRTNRPARVGADRDWVAVAGGAGHSMALKDAGLSKAVRSSDRFFPRAAVQNSGCQCSQSTRRTGASRIYRSPTRRAGQHISMKQPKTSSHDVNSETIRDQAAFSETHWSKLMALREGGSEERRAILEFLIRRYWKPVYCFVRRLGFDDEHAKDLVQEFFMVALSKDLFAKADPMRGRFRNLLLKALQHFLANSRRNAAAQKRRPDQGFVSIHELSTEDGTVVVPKDSETPDEVFHRTWLRELVLRVLKTLEVECLTTSKRTHFELLRLRIIEPILEGGEAPSLRTLAEQYGMTDKEVANHVLTARRAYHRLLRDEIRLYATSEVEVAAEIQDLWRFMSE